MKKRYNFSTLGDAPIVGETQKGTVDGSQDKDIPTSRCPHCHCQTSRVIETRPITISGYTFIGRRRRCRYCKKVFRTVETSVEDLKWPSADNRRSTTKHPDVGAVFPPE